MEAGLNIVANSNIIIINVIMICCQHGAFNTKHLSLLTYIQHLWVLPSHPVRAASHHIILTAAR